MNKIKFPKLTGLQVAFGGYPKEEWDKWYAAAKSADFDKRYKNLFSTIFYRGGSLTKKKDSSIDNETYNAGVNFFRCIAGSFEPKHEHKELVCAYILSLIAELPKELEKAPVF